MLKRFVALVVVSVVLGTAAVPRSYAQYFSRAPGVGEPSVFNYGWRGLYIGSLAGLSAGYLRYKDSDDRGDDILRSVAWGALAGAGVGLALGFADVSYGRKAYGDIILYDMGVGGGFGAAVGTLVGGIMAIANEDWDPLAEGASWGYLGGVVLGVFVGIYEAPRLLNEPVTPAPPVSRLSIMPTVVADSRRNAVGGIGITYNF